MSFLYELMDVDFAVSKKVKKAVISKLGTEFGISLEINDLASEAKEGFAILTETVRERIKSDSLKKIKKSKKRSAKEAEIREENKEESEEIEISFYFTFPAYRTKTVHSISHSLPISHRSQV